LEIYEEAEINPFMYLHLCLTQRKCIEDFDGNVNIDFIGRYENFIDDLKYVLHHILKLPKRNIQQYHLNKTQFPIQICLDDVEELSNMIHSEDFIEFNYSVK
jgi:hypothetical protein